MNIFWQTTDTTYEMHRYPKGEHDKSLQAWDSADELLVSYIKDNTNEEDSLTIFNDSFGAINIGLHQWPKTSINDSYISFKALEQNLTLNELTSKYQSNSQTLNSLDTFSWSSHMLIKLTKNLGYLEHQLSQIQKLEKPCKIIATGKTNQVTSSVLKLFEKYFSNVSTSLAKKKSRLIFAEHLATKERIPTKYPVKTEWAETRLVLLAHANVFSKEQIDIGGRFLAENLPRIEDNQRIIDLGCGNGLLGLSCLLQAKSNNVNVRLVFVDESYMAVNSAKKNVELQFSDSIKNCQFVQDDCLTQQADRSADIVLCNPPFHQQNAITEHIAQQMFSDAHRVLKSSGKLYVVANRHLPYQGQLKKHFGGFKVHQKNKKFIIYSCIKA